MYNFSKEINLQDNIDFEIELTIIFYSEYYTDTKNGDKKWEKFNDDVFLANIHTYQMWKDLIEEEPLNIIFVPENMISDELCKLAVRLDGYTLQFIKDQTGEICKLAVQKNGYALAYVKDQTEEICRLAVQQNGFALKYVRDQTEEICKLAVQRT